MSQPRAKNEPRSNQDRRRAEYLRKRLSPRVRDVFRDLMADKPDAGAYLEGQCLMVAELSVLAEALRTRLETMMAAPSPDEAGPLRSLATLINAVTRLQSTARRAAADLGKVTHVEVDPVADLKAYLHRDRTKDVE